MAPFYRKNLWTCEECGLTVTGTPLKHICNRERFANHQLMLFEDQFTQWLATKEGLFAQYIAAKDVEL
jgi:hypothetical protein